MGLIGWYYLHTNGSLIYKPDFDGTAADIRESDFAVSMWPVDNTDRETCWTILVEASALGVSNERIKELVETWNCTNEDAIHYAERVGCVLCKDENKYMAARKDFVDLQESQAGFGDSNLEAMADLCKRLGYTGGKMWNPGFKDLLK